MSLLWPKREADKTYDTVELEHDPEKRVAVFRKDHAQTKG
jgi:hypothetical protein